MGLGQCDIVGKYGRLGIQTCCRPDVTIYVYGVGIQLGKERLFMLQLAQ